MSLNTHSHTHEPMNHTAVDSQQEAPIAGYHPSFLGITLNALLALIYSVLGALSVLQSLSALESSTCTNVFETNGTRTRPYFLSVFSLGVISRLLYIIVCLVINLAPNLMASELLNKLDILKVFDYLISVVFLTSYSIVIALWSSILTDSGSFKCSMVTLLNVVMYATSGAMLAVTLFFSQWMPPIFSILRIFIGFLHLVCSYFWICYGSSLVGQIKRRQSMHRDMQKGLISKNSGFVWNAGSNTNKSAANYHQTGGIFSSPLEFGILSNDHVSIVQFNQDPTALITTSSSSNSSCSVLSGLFIYNEAYNASINQLRRKIQILTIVCPISLFISSASSLSRGLGLVHSDHSVLPNTVCNALYMLSVETVPSIALIYGFWSSKNSFLDARVYKSCYNQHTTTEDNYFRRYTRIY